MFALQAALAGARQGKRVLLIEKGGSLGGAASQSLIMPFMDWTTTVLEDGEAVSLPLSRGIFTEILKALSDAGGGHGNGFHEEYLKLVLDRMMKAAKVDVLFHTIVFSAERLSGRIIGVAATNVGGVQEYQADFFVDCSGDANLAALSGCPFQLGRPEDSLCQPMTLCFRVANVDTSAIDRKGINRIYQKAQAEGRIQNPREDVLMFSTMVDGLVHFNSTRIIRKNPINAFDVSMAEMEAREQMIELIGFLKAEVPAFSNAQLVASAPAIGVRESRRIEGEYKSLSKKACTMHSIKSTRLEAATLYAIRQQVHLAVSYSTIVSQINVAPLKKSQSVRLNELIITREKELAKILRYKQTLYQDWKDGHITHNDYRHMSEDYERQNEAISAVIANLKTERDELENGIDTDNPFLTTFRKYENIDKLTREILIELVDVIKVYEGGDISIKFKFADELRRITEYIEVNSHLQVG